MGTKTCTACAGTGRSATPSGSTWVRSGICNACGGTGRVDDKPSCFVGLAPILTPQGWQPISHLKKGDRIVSYDHTTDAAVIRHIEKQQRHQTAIIWEVSVTESVDPICTTRIHSFLTNRGWKRTNQLKVGDILTTFGREKSVVSSIIETTRVEPVFNLIAEGEYTFIAQGCVVHSFTYFRNFRVWWHRCTRPRRRAETQDFVVAN